MAVRKDSGCTDKKQERWKSFGMKGWQASNLGRIRSRWQRWSGKWLSEWFLVKQRRRSYGYLAVWIDGEYYFVHRLVLEAFVGPRPPKHDTRHLNDIKDDNRLENLAWGTRQENMIEAVKNGRRKIGEKHYKSVLTCDDVLAIRRLCESGTMTQAKIAFVYGVDPSQISNIKRRTVWKHV